MKKVILIFVFFSYSVFSNELPELGSIADNLLSAKEEKKITFQILNRVYQSNQLIEDPEINNYVTNMGKDLSFEGTKEKPKINFFVVNDSSINAFATLGGVIGIHSGLILAANNESELASVLSHEIAHITQKHLLRLFESQKRNSYKSYLALAIAILAARSNPQLANSAIAISQATGVQDTLDYTRANEREADRIGLEILHKSGYDPKGFVTFFQTIQKFNEFVSGAAPSWLRTHPVTTERISDIQNRIDEFSYIQKINPLEFYLVKAKLQALFSNSENVSSTFERKIAKKTYLNKTAELYGLTYSYLKEKKINKARINFNLLKKEKIEHPMITELEANLLMNEKKYNQALQLYLDALRKFPNTKIFVYGISNLLIADNQTDKAINFIKKYEQIFNNDPEIFRILSSAYSKQGNNLLQFESLSDYFYYRYDIQAALTQMDMAVKTNSGSFYDKSRVEYRLKELERESKLMED